MSTAPTEQHRYRDPVTPPPVDHTVAESWDEGAGIVSSGADVVEAIGSGDAGRIASSSASFGLEALGFVADPFAGIFEPLVTYAIEHVPFLHESLDYLAGDPIQIKQHAQTWEKVSNALADMAVDYRRDVDSLQSWTGPASAAYRTDAGTVVASMEAGKKMAADLGQDVLAAGELIGTVRTFIRDLIAECVAKLLKWAIAAVAASVVTAGVSVAAFLGDAALELGALTAKISTRIGRLLDELGAAAKVLAQRVDDFGDAIKPALTRLRGSALGGGKLWSEVLPDGPPKLVEIGKWAEETEETLEKHKIDKIVEEWKEYEEEDGEAEDAPDSAPSDWRSKVAQERAA